MKFRVFKTSEVTYTKPFPDAATDVEFSTLEELMEFVGSLRVRKYYGIGKEIEVPLEVILYKKDGVNCIEIYDDYRE